MRLHPRVRLIPKCKLLAEIVAVLVELDISSSFARPLAVRRVMRMLVIGVGIFQCCSEAIRLRSVSRTSACHAAGLRRRQ